MSAHEISTTNKRGVFSTGQMTHSLSTLSGADGTTLTTRHGGGKKLAVRIQMLDDSITLFQVQAKAIGKLLFEQVCRQLNLLEADYFGLEYQEQTTRTKYWLDLLKPLNRQVGLSLVEPLLRFCIKFYTPDPSQLEEEYTRYLFCLQIKRDLATGSLQCNDNTAALMASYIVQASCGDFVPEDYPDHTYLSSHRFVPHQDTIMQRKIMENHKKHTGQSPAEADLNLLETARRCELYGMKMHSAKDIEGVPLNLSVAHMGVSVFQGITRINVFSWAKIRKISFKRKRFLIKLHPEGYGYYKDTVEFFFDGRNECKNFWKKCVENHGFFRCVSVTNPPRRKTKVLSRGSSFRYSGKTQKQIIEFVRENYVKRQNFQRSQSFRQGPLNASSRSQSHTYVNSSISANPLLPINTAEWDSHNHCSTSTMQFLTKKSTDTWGHPKDNLTEHSHSQVTAAQVEIYQTRNYVLESPILEGSHIPRSAVDQMDQMNMQRSVSPLAPQSWNSPKHSKIGTKDQDQAHVLLGKYNLGQSQSSHLYNNNSPQRVSMGSQACVTAPPQQAPITTSINNFNQSRIISVDLNNSSEEKEEAALSGIEKNSNLTTSTSSQGNIAQLQERSQHFIPALYSSMNYLTSKQSSINNNTSIETDTDNIIYTDINNIYYSKYPNEYTCEVEHKISNENNLNIINGGDIYATVNRKTKLKSKVNHISDEFFDQSIEKNLLSKRNSLNNSLTQTYLDHMPNNCYTDNIYNKQYTFDSSKAQENLESYANPKLGEFKNITRSELSIGPTEMQTQTNHHTLPLPKKSELSCEHSMDSYDSHYKTYELYEALHTRNDVNNLMYGNEMKLHKTTDGRLSTHSNPPRLSSDKLEHEPSNIHFYSAAQFKQQEYKDSWLKSSSCKDLLIESEKYKPFPNFVKGFLSYNRIESPVTRYDDSQHSMYSNKNQCNNTYQDFSAIVDSKIYSSSYPGSTRNNFGYHKRVYENQFLDYTGSQDDISHDSYELLEKYNPEFIDKHTRSDHNIRSCSIDSGNFIPSDDEIASGNQKYRSALDIKSKSAADIMNEIWDSEDPRYFPRENLSVKSDGSFYKKVREVQDSQSSSQESQSDIYETKASRSSWCSKKSRDSLYHTDSKKSRESSKSKTSVVSSGGSKESLTEDFLSRNYEMPMTTGKKVKKNSKNNQYQQHSSVESKSDYYDAQDFMETDWLNRHPKVKSITCLLSDKQDSMVSRFQCEYRDTYSTFPSNKNTKTSKVHSISLQNVEIKKNATSFSTNSPENLNFYKYQDEKEARNSISINGEHSKRNLDKECQTNVPFRRKSDSENIFSFDRDKIESLTSNSTQDEKTDEGNIKNSPDYPLTPELISEFDKQIQNSKAKTVTRKEELIAKTHFEEYNPKVINNQPVQLPNVLLPLTYVHATVERTKSDPNSLANRSGLCKNQRRHVLMHQKSIDLTPADSSDEDYYYRQIPSAPPQCKTFGNFEIPKASETQVAPIDITKTGFETPKSFFHEFEYRASKVLKEEIPYVLHKRHVVNGTNLSPIEKKHQRPKSPKTPKSPKSQTSSNNTKKVKCSNKMLPDILDNVVPELREGFLFTQNVDLSKINPISLEFNNTVSKIDHSSPKCDLSEQLDIKLLEKLNIKLSKIENDSATNSKTENNIFKEQLSHILEHKPSELKEIIVPSRMTVAKRTISKTRLTNKIKRSKTRITSFSSDDESLDSDDVFGSTEPMPSALEFSPPQSRKEIEPILRIEQSKLISAAWGRGQTMSSTEIEGSPPQCRRLTDLESHYDPLKLNSPYHNATELRRISERSISIPSSEEEMYASAKVICVSTGEYQQNENIPFPILMPFNPAEADKKIVSTLRSDNKAGESINYTLKKNDCKNVSISGKNSTSNNSKENVSIVFSQVRLNLSEGSGLACLQKQKSDLESTDRRAKSLDTPFISMHKLPPINAFSSKDDTIEFEEEVEILEEKALHNEMSNIEEETHYSVRSCAGSIPSAQVCHSTFRHDPILSTVNIDFEENDLLHQLKFIEKISLKGVKIKDREKSKMELRSGEHLILDIPKYNFDYSPLNSCNSSRKTSPGVSRASSLESTGMRKSKTRSKSSDAMKLKLSIGNVSSIKKDKKNILKENSKFVESERRLSKEKNKSNEETEADIAKRKERQQKLYESAMKQTVTMLSPVGDQLPPFPAPEDKISVKTEGDKIIIETEFKSRAKDHVLITKAPRKLDTSLVKFSRSFDEGGCQKKLEKANRSFEDRKKSFEDSEKSEPTSDFAVESPKATIKNRQFEGKDASNRDVKSSNLDKKSIGDDKKKNNASKSLSSEREFKSEDNSEKPRTAVGDRKIFANHFYFNEEIDMQAVISERRSLEILNRHSPRSDEMARDSDGSHIPSTGESIDSCVSIDESTSDSKPLFTADGYPQRVPTIECEEPSIEGDENNISECRQSKKSRFSAYHLSLDRSRSDETGSWITVECDEYIGSDLSENDPRTLEPDTDALEKQATLDDEGEPNTTVSTDNLSKCAQNINVILPNTNQSSKKTIEKQKASPEFESKQKGTFSQQSDKSKSSDSWTSGEGNAGSPKLRNERYDWSLSFSGKEKSSIDDESSVSCSIARPLGISQDFGDFETKKCLELKQQMLKLDLESTDRQNIISDEIANTVPIKKSSTPVLEKQSPVDFGTSTEVLEYDIRGNTQDLQKDDSNLSPNSSVKIPNICKPARKTTSRNPCLTAIGPVAQIGKTESNQSSQESKSSFDSKASLSVESKGSFETESSSGSLGLAQRRGELFQKEQQSTWKSFPIENSSNSSVEEPNKNIDLESIEQIDNLSAIRDLSESDFIELSLQAQTNDEQCQDELIDFPTTFGYPVMTSALSGIGINPTDIIGYSTGFATGRTLSRISERSTASEKSSIEDDVSKASTQSVSVRDESACSTDHQPSLSSDSRSNTNMAYISDADRRTSAEMPDIPCDSATGERLSSISSINEPKSTTVITGRFAVTQVEEKNHEEFDKHTLLCLSNPGSQDSEDWPLPEIPYDSVPVKPTELIFSVPNLDKRVPKTFCWKPSMPLQFHDSQSWLSPTSDGGEISFDENVKLYQTSEKQSDPGAMNRCTKEDATNIRQCSKFETSPTSKKTKVLPYADTSYFMSSPFDLKNEKHDTTCLETEGKNSPTCLNSVPFLPYSFNYNCCSASKSVPDSFLLTENISEGIVILQPTRSPIHSPTSAEEAASNDDVFFPGTTKVQVFSDESHESEPDPKTTLRSYNSDTSVDEIASTSGITYKEDEMNVLRSFDKRLRTGSCRKCSHSSYSEDETISNDTDVDGTVRMGLQLKKCTHSSHSEDTSIGLSISEWSTGTNNVHQYANLSGSDSLSAVSNHSMGVKSEKSNQTKSRRSSFNKSSESLNGKSANFSGSKKLSGESGLADNLKYDILSSSETDKCSDSLTKSDDTTLTLTEIAQIGTEWSTSSSRTLISSKPQVPNTNEVKNKVGSFIEYMPLKNPRKSKNVSPPSDNNVSFPLVHKNKNSSSLDNDSQRTQHVPPTCVVDMKEKYNTFGRPSKQKNSFEMMPKSFRNQKSISDEEAFSEYLYPSNEKFSARYQSQEFVPLQKSVVESVGILDTSSLPEKKIQHHKSNEDRTTHTLQDCHEQINSSTRENTLNKGSHITTTTTTHQINIGYAEPTTSKNISSPYTSGDDKSVRRSLFKTRSLSTETHSTQMTEKLLRSGSVARSSYVNTPTSGNDTDSSLDLRNQELEIRCRGFRKKRPMPKKRMRSERLRLEQGVFEWSKDYPSDNEAPKLSCDDNLKIDEEELYSDAYHPYEDFFCSNVGSDDMSSNNEDAIESPLYDQVTDQIYPQSSSFNQYRPTADKQHIKPARQKKRQLNREESITINKYSFEQEAAIADEFQHEENDLLFPYSLSYYGNEELDIEQDKCGLDIRIDPPQNFSNATD